MDHTAILSIANLKDVRENQNDEERDQEGCKKSAREEGRSQEEEKVIRRPIGDSVHKISGSGNGAVLVSALRSRPIQTTLIIPSHKVSSAPTAVLRPHLQHDGCPLEPKPLAEPVHDEAFGREVKRSMFVGEHDERRRPHGCLGNVVDLDRRLDPESFDEPVELPRGDPL
jgi:hypothetical protein